MLPIVKGKRNSQKKKQIRNNKVCFSQGQLENDILRKIKHILNDLYSSMIELNMDKKEAKWQNDLKRNF